MTLVFHRVLKLTDPPMTGYDVWGAKRAVYRFLGDGAKWQGFLKQTNKQKMTFGEFFKEDVGLAQDQLTAGRTRGQFDEGTLRALEDAGAFDEIAKGLWRMQFPPPPEIVFPVPIGYDVTVCQGLHPTAGLMANWAIDFCAPPKTPIVSSEAGTVFKLSGHPPSEDTWDAMGIFGWTVYVRTHHGYVYFITHLGSRTVKLGQAVKACQIVGYVGDQHYRPDHCHVGVTSPLGPADARKRITAVSKAPRERSV